MAKKNSEWKNIKKEAETGLNVTKQSIGEIGEDLKKSAEVFGQDMKKMADGLAQGFDMESKKSGKRGKKLEKNIFETFKDNLVNGDSSKKLQAWVILIGSILIVCGIFVAIFG